MKEEASDYVTEEEMPEYAEYVAKFMLQNYEEIKE